MQKKDDQELERARRSREELVPTFTLEVTNERIHLKTLYNLPYLLDQMLELEEKLPNKNTALEKTPQCILYSRFI